MGVNFLKKLKFSRIKFHNIKNTPPTFPIHPYPRWPLHWGSQLQLWSCKDLSSNVQMLDSQPCVQSCIKRMMLRRAIKSRGESWGSFESLITIGTTILPKWMNIFFSFCQWKIRSSIETKFLNLLSISVSYSLHL